MDQPNENARKDPESLAPVQLESARDEEALAGMRGGQGLRLGLALLVLVAAGAGGAQLLKSMDARRAYEQAAAQLERGDSEQGEAFMRCALPNIQRSQVASPDALQRVIDGVSERLGKGYAKQLGQCTQLLASFEQAIRDVKAPTDVKPQLDAVSKSAHAFASAWSGHKDFMQHSSETYDREQAALSIAKITAAWRDYQSARVQAKQALSARL